jgi:hypothetical protein
VAGGKQKRKMKTPNSIGQWTIVCILLCLAFLITKSTVISREPDKIEWVNDAVYYQTNQIWDEERNANRPTNQYGFYYYYTKDVTSTNKVSPWYFTAGDRKVELGFRSDGVMVWRNAKGEK